MRATPSFAHGLLGIARFALLRTIRSRRIIIAAISMLVLVIAVAGGRKMGNQTPGAAWQSAVSSGLLSFVAYLIPFLFHASSFSEEHEDRTLSYLVTRPVPMSALVLGKYLAGAAASVTIALGTTALLFFASYVGSFDLVDWGEVARAFAATGLLVLGHGAIASAYSTMSPEHATPITVVHFALGELLLPHSPGVLRLLSMHQHAMDIAGIPRETGSFGASVPVLPLSAQVGFIVVYASLFLGLACIIASGREYRFAKS